MPNNDLYILREKQYAFREDLIATLIKDLVGPAAEDEIINDFPLERYGMGVLYPQGEKVSRVQDNNFPQDDPEEGGMIDPPVALANVKNPSSAGMSFTVDTEITKDIRVNLSAARYLPLKEVPQLISYSSISTDEENGEDDVPPTPVEKQEWKRQPLSIEPVQLDIMQFTENGRVLVADGLELFYRIRLLDKSKAAVTLVLLNTFKTSFDLAVKNRQSFFQIGIEVTAQEKVLGAFVERTTNVVIGNEKDLRSYRLLYSNSREFAVGHGCSVDWTLNAASKERANSIHTTFTPKFELRIADSNPNIVAKCINMLYLKEAPQSEIISELRTFYKGYGDWIEDRKKEVKGLPFKLQDVAKEHLDACNKALLRMDEGIKVLESDSQIWKAFHLANTAMLQQRARTEWLRSGRPKGGPLEGPHLNWRPFQLAFILLCLKGISDPKSDDRNIADLLWFPTGGGKTEAYLGLIAFTVFLRRLRNPVKGGGVTALMRYTLRLLTIQQFERAALLICCCEKIRRENKELGSDPISLGLWVGRGATPNTLDDARAAINKLRLNSEPDRNTGNPVQLHSCPWCGVKLDHNNYWIQTDYRRLMISCRKDDCIYSKGLPVFVVDEDIYNYRPTLIIATVDKFASLPLKDQAAELFNLQTAVHQEQLKPELIIQDELHLISGPLGTLVGLYETAIDILCSQDGTKPKIVASTATIRRSGEQIGALFNRKISQFPPAGLAAGDSYFATEAPSEERGTRLYLGLMAPGLSHTTLLVRTYAALLQNVKDIPEDDQVKDPYWTLVGYFNSLRVLGGARMQVQDDVEDRLELLARQNGTEKREIDESGIIELTSRESSNKIPRHLANMSIGLPSENTLDVILATNMISVGVDIDRFGLMVVMGQPQSTSEYIQSSSRVGRKFPGLVVVLFNSARSRDRSHYESFITYHSALYRQVEAAGVTPFSARARDRGLHAVLISLTRLLLPDFRPNSAADRILQDEKSLEVIINLIIERVREVNPDEVEKATNQLKDLVRRWRKRAQDNKGLTYQNPRDNSKALMVEATVDTFGQDKAFPTPWSLRDVDSETKLTLVQGEE